MEKLAKSFIKLKRKNRFLIKTYKADTERSRLQVTILQLQGSTEDKSQLSMIFRGSFRSPFIAIRATTASITNDFNDL